ncbi:MAG TPA: hypothetical protein VGF92_15765 [Stellaceae bacterium]
MFTLTMALARSLAKSGALDRNIWLNELMAARSWLGAQEEAEAALAFEQIMEMAADV